MESQADPKNKESQERRRTCVTYEESVDLEANLDSLSVDIRVHIRLLRLPYHRQQRHKSDRPEESAL